MKEGDNTAAGGEGMDYNRQQGDNTASEVQSAANSEEGDSDDNGMDYNRQQGDNLLLGKLLAMLLFFGGGKQCSTFWILHCLSVLSFLQRCEGERERLS